MRNYFLDTYQAMRVMRKIEDYFERTGWLIPADSLHLESLDDGTFSIVYTTPGGGTELVPDEVLAKVE